MLLVLFVFAYLVFIGFSMSINAFDAVVIGVSMDTCVFDMGSLFLL